MGNEMEPVVRGQERNPHECRPRCSWCGADIEHPGCNYYKQTGAAPPTKRTIRTIHDEEYPPL